MGNKWDQYEKRWQQDKLEIERAFIEILFVAPSVNLWAELRKVRDYDNWSQLQDAQQQYYQMMQKGDMIDFLSLNESIDDVDKLEIYSKKSGKVSFTSKHWLKFFLQEFFDTYGGKSNEEYDDDQEQTALPAGARKPKKAINTSHETKFYHITSAKLFKLMNEEYTGYTDKQYYLLIGMILIIRGYKLASRKAGEYFSNHNLNEDDREVIISRVKTWVSRGTP